MAGQGHLSVTPLFDHQLRITLGSMHMFVVPSETGRRSFQPQERPGSGPDFRV
jgi:hypothetical protein